MYFTIDTRHTPEGFAFPHNELAAIGIRDGSKCWGHWIEGRHLQQNSCLKSDEQRWRNESPHFVLSPIHPDLWVTAFNLDVLLHRRHREPGRPPDQCDSMHGLMDALGECGVNILFVSTAQMGYDLIAVHATCELPALRPDASKILKEADDAGQRANYSRQKISSRSEHERRAAAKTIEEMLSTARVQAFASLGLLMVPRLAELEARLTAIDGLRFLADRLGRRSARRRFHWEDHQDFVRDVARRCLGFLVRDGMTTDSPRESDLRRTAEALTRAWYFNKNVIEAGENPYYLSYDVARHRNAAHDELRKNLDADPLRAISDESAGELWRNVYLLLKGRRLSHKFKTSVAEIRPDRTGPVNSAEDRRTQSGTEERIARFSRQIILERIAQDPRVFDSDISPEVMELLIESSDLGPDFEEYSHRRFFEQQSLFPVKISALTTLAYARLWAFAGSREPAAPIEFEYGNGVLYPASTTGVGNYAALYEFLNNITGVGGDDRGVFGDGMAVLVNVNVQERMARLRFVRRDQEQRGFITLTVKYSVLGGATATSGSSQGLVKRMSALLLNHGLRIERCSNTLLACALDRNTSATQNESGLVTIIARSASHEGDALCDRVRECRPAELDLLRRDWKRYLFERGAHELGSNQDGDGEPECPGIDRENTSLTILPGFVPPKKDTPEPRLRRPPSPGA